MCKSPDGAVLAEMHRYLRTEASLDDLYDLWEIRDWGMSWADARLANMQAAAPKGPGPE